jgi:Fic family protein
VVYTPPKTGQHIVDLMCNLENFINNDELSDYHDLVKMALIHHQFESIHPFYDGNGRTGRILNILYLSKQNLLGAPVLYLSRYLNKNKAQYYQLLQAVRGHNANSQSWEAWLLFMLNIHRNTASKYINKLVDIGVLTKRKLGKENYYLNNELYALLSE